MATDLVALHHAAEAIAPDARIEERAAVLSRLGIEDHHVVCDVPAWGGYFARGVSNPSRVICLEGSPTMVVAPGCKIIASPPLRHAIGDATVDRLASLVGFHHYTQPQTFINEAFRVLRPGGRAVFSEVIARTTVAAFLNEDVDRHRASGHKGTFVEPGGLSALMHTAGFDVISEEEVSLFWRFRNVDQMTLYFKNFFALTIPVEEILAALGSRFCVVDGANGVRVPWPLVYGVGMKPLV